MDLAAITGKTEVFLRDSFHELITLQDGEGGGVRELEATSQNWTARKMINVNG